MIELELTNFQSFKHETFQFKQGITVITGPNSSGKTAIFRGLEALITNPVGAKDFIKYGTKKAQVKLSFGDMVFTWNRRETGVTYQVNEQKYSKVGRDNIYNVFPDFPLLQDNRGSLLNMHTEWDIMFPFDRSDGELFKLFEDIFQIADSTTVIKGFAQDQKEFKAEDLRLKQSEERIATKLQAIDDLGKLVDLAILDRYEKDISQATQELTGLSEAVAELKNATKYLITTRDIQKQVFDLELIPEMIQLEADILKIQGLLPVLKANIPRQTFDLEILKDLKELSHDVGVAKEFEYELKLADELLISYQKKKAELQEKLDSFTTCPLCNQRIK